MTQPYGQQPDPNNYGQQAYPPADAYPPAGPYGGQPGPVTPAAKPQSISTAVKLMYATAALTVLSFLFSLTQLGEMKDTIRQTLRENGEKVTEDIVNASFALGIVFMVLMVVVMAGLWLLFARFIDKGRSWARIVVTILGGLAILFTFIGLFGEADALSKVLSVIQVLLVAATLFFLWKKESSDFFRASAAPTGYYQ